MAAAEQLPFDFSLPRNVEAIGAVLMRDPAVAEAAERSDPRCYADHWTFEAAMVAETEPRPCALCGRRDDMVERLRAVKLQSRGGELCSVPWWLCERCDRWGYPVIADVFEVRRFYESSGGRR